MKSNVSDLASVLDRLLLAVGFMEYIKNHREQNVKKSELLCVDESISRLHGKGESRIEHGLPMYIAIDRKLENRCKI
eukprot:IDg15668t1